MKSNKAFWVAIAALSFVTMVSFVYAFIQAGIATEFRRMASQNAKEALMASERAKQMEAIANQARIELEKCKGEKK